MGNLSENVATPLNAESAKEYSLIPDGPLEVKIDSCEVKPGKNNPDSRIVHITYVSMDPRKPGQIREFLTIKHPTVTAQEIGINKLNLLAKSVGIAGDLEDTNQLIGQVCAIEVASEPRNDKPEYSNNVVRRYLPKEEWINGLPEAGPAAPAMTATAVPEQQQGTQWGNKAAS